MKVDDMSQLADSSVGTPASPVNQQDQQARQWQAFWRQQNELAALRQELKWTQEQLEQVRTTKLWRWGTLYWRAHARVRQFLQQRQSNSAGDGELVPPHAQGNGKE